MIKIVLYKIENIFYVLYLYYIENFFIYTHYSDADGRAFPKAHTSVDKACQQEVVAQNWFGGFLGSELHRGDIAERGFARVVVRRSIGRKSKRLR
ncbi:MAG: hypothetical protein MRJ65_16510 [Candidatus Brocadiaceae bacterium]|nr:hypothetical protein [Candidatus Brocadiaceae bacterium]